MSEDKYKKFKGYKFAPITYKVTGDAIRAYAKATGDLKPEYTDPDDSKIIAPPSFLSVVFLPSFYGAGKLAEEGIIKDFTKLLHGGQRYEYYQPIRPGDVLSSQVEVIDIYVKNNMLFLIFDIPIKKQDDTLVGKVVTTAIIRPGGF
ncbi:MAG: MaoC family dehydratase N-terminal domain-containing protein [Candidatus Freyarchaeota archaeon]